MMDYVIQCIVNSGKSKLMLVMYVSHKASLLVKRRK